MVRFFVILAAAISPMIMTASSTTGSAVDTTQPILAQARAGQAIRMDYQLKASAWFLFLPITGQASFSIDLKPRTYRIQSNVKTTGLAGILVNYDMALAASGYLRPDQLDTYAYVSQNSDGRKNRRVDLRYLADDFEMVANPTFGNLGDPAANAAQVLAAKDPITALISFALEPRAPGADPCGGPLRIFDGRQLTHLHLEYHGIKDVRATAWSGSAYECHVTIEKIAGYDADEINTETLSALDGPLRMWLAPLDNGVTIPVRIEANSKDIGTVTLQASQLDFTPLEL
ncbi:MAG: hypothetical protein CME93_00725 [Hyphomonadaceae bacterium]|nr:hypothetical protein [Hyphomonadaceae bacterium]OUX95642.1 MAG: hypothetical protein CBB77_00465 [Hyphomonas sp. TMED17]